MKKQSWNIFGKIIFLFLILTSMFMFLCGCLDSKSDRIKERKEKYKKGANVDITNEEIEEKDISEMSDYELLNYYAYYCLTSDGLTPDEMLDTRFDYLSEELNGLLDRNDNNDPSCIKYVYFGNDLGEQDELFNGRIKIEKKIPVKFIIHFCEKCSNVNEVEIKCDLSEESWEKIIDFIEDLPYFKPQSDNLKYIREYDMSTYTIQPSEFNYDTCVRVVPGYDEMEIFYDKCTCESVSSYSPDKSDGHVGDNDGDGDVDEKDFMEEWNNYLDKNMP